MIFSKWRRTSLPVAWEYATAGVLWRLLPSAQGVFVLEDRKLDAKSVTFAAVDMHSGDVLWQNVSVAERWWVSIELVEGSDVILHGYGTPDMPDHRHITLLDLRTGALRWHNDELALLFASGDRVYGTKEEFERRRTYELDRGSGTVLRELDAAELDALRPPAVVPAEELVTFPEACGDPRELGEELRRTVAAAAAGGTPGLVEVLRHRGYEAVGVHVQRGADPGHQALTQRLIVRRDGRTVFEDVMATDAALSVPDGFFAAADRLYYMKDQRILRALALHGS